MIVHWTLYHLVVLLTVTETCRNVISFLPMSSSLHSSSHCFQKIVLTTKTASFRGNKYCRIIGSSCLQNCDAVQKISVHNRLQCKTVPGSAFLSQGILRVLDKEQSVPGADVTVQVLQTPRGWHEALMNGLFHITDFKDHGRLGKTTIVQYISFCYLKVILFVCNGNGLVVYWQ